MTPSTTIDDFGKHVAETKRPPRVLVVDDDESDLEFVKRVMRGVEHPLDGIYCNNGVDAIKTLSESVCDVVFLDLRMPHQDGLGVMQEMKRKGITTPVAVMTGLSNGPMVAEALSMGAIIHIKKPLEPAHVKQVLHMLKL